jgi:hypothetical protein
LIFSSSRLPASANSLLGASISIPPIVALGPLQVLRNIGILSRRGERMPRTAAPDRKPISPSNPSSAKANKPVQFGYGLLGEVGSFILGMF